MIELISAYYLWYILGFLVTSLIGIHIELNDKNSHFSKMDILLSIALFIVFWWIIIWLIIWEHLDTIAEFFTIELF